MGLDLSALTRRRCSVAAGRGGAISAGDARRIHEVLRDWPRARKGATRKGPGGKAKAEGRRQKADGRRRKAEGGRRKAEGEMQNIVIERDGAVGTILMDRAARFNAMDVETAQDFRRRPSSWRATRMSGSSC